ncbi:MAG: hypothetical protein U0168_06395 [Nannocystaceae bacterium]
MREPSTAGAAPPSFLRGAEVPARPTTGPIHTGPATMAIERCSTAGERLR